MTGLSCEMHDHTQSSRSRFLPGKRVTHKQPRTIGAHRALIFDSCLALNKPETRLRLFVFILRMVYSRNVDMDVLQQATLSVLRLPGPVQWCGRQVIFTWTRHRFCPPTTRLISKYPFVYVVVCTEIKIEPLSKHECRMCNALILNPRPVLSLWTPTSTVTLTSTSVSKIFACVYFTRSFHRSMSISDKWTISGISFFESFCWLRTSRDGRNAIL